MTAEKDFSKLWSRFLLKLKAQNPFFSTLAMFASFELSEEIEYAQTQHQKLIVSPIFLAELPEQQQFSYLLHQILHLALQHVKRGEGRDQRLWNIAADIAANQIISDTTEWPFAPMTAWDYRFDGQSVERIYASLQKEVEKDSSQQSPSGGSGNTDAYPIHSSSFNQDNCTQASSSRSEGKGGERDNCQSAVQATPTATGETLSIKKLQEKYHCHQDFSTLPAEDVDRSNTYWRSATTRAKQLHPNPHYGKHSESLEREIELSCQTQLDWRQLLWKYATPTLSDYSEFDNRFIYCGYYTETLQSESLSVDIIIDTSGSVSKSELSTFVTELIAIKRCHPLVSIQLFYADNELYGPYEMPESISGFQMPVGGGGTSFTPYFNKLEKQNIFINAPQAAIYLTDGFGVFPGKEPSIPVLWILTEDGCDDSNVPFGTIVRLKISKDGL